MIDCLIDFGLINKAESGFFKVAPSCRSCGGQDGEPSGPLRAMDGLFPGPGGAITHEDDRSSATDVAASDASQLVASKVACGTWSGVGCNLSLLWLVLSNSG